METYYDEKQNIIEKEIDDIDFDLLITASMNKYVCSSKEHPILGTYALATCIGIIIYDDYGNFNLAHIASEYELIIKRMVKNMKNTNPIKVIIIPGYYTRVETIYEIIEYLKSRENFLYYDFEIEIKILKNYINEELPSIEFAFDTRTKEFIKPDYDKYLKERGR